MFHLKNNIFWRRLRDGSVRVFQLKSPPSDFPEANTSLNTANVVFDLVIDLDGWASIVASVSAGGEENLRFFAAREFHDSSGEVSVVQKGSQ